MIQLWEVFEVLESYKSIDRHVNTIPHLTSPFSALLYCDEESSVDRMNSYCDLLIASGCKYFHAIGKNHMKWHIAFDEANIRHAPALNDDDVISTVSDEELEYDAIENWVMLSEHTIHEINTGLVIYETEFQLYKTDCYFRQANHVVSIEIDFP